jgi:osmotically-inducible protein OsmY
MPGQSARTLILLCVVVGLVGSPGLVSGDAAGDREIRKHIAKHTHHDERLEGTQVHLVVRDGHVVLAGTVSLYSQKLLYAHIVGRTPGVVEITNDIRVVPRAPVEDAAIAAHIRMVIKEHRRLHHAEITVEVTEGAVSLRGTFYDPSDVLFLKHQVAAIEGVTGLEVMARFIT